MLVKTLAAVFVVFSQTAGMSFSAENNNTEVRLLEHILHGYNREARPLKNISKALKIRLGINLKQIASVDFTKQVLTLQVWIRLWWTDEFITWNPDDYDGLKIISINPSRLWWPEVALYNTGSLESGEAGNIQMLYKIKVKHDGLMHWSSPAVLTSECKVEVLYFPFDSQNCSLELGSWSEDGEKVDWSLQYDHFDTEAFSPNDEWLLVDNKAWRKVMMYKCCKEPYPSVMFSISLKRRAMFYFLNLIVPCGLLAIVSLFSFILPPNSGERVSFVITVLLALAVYMMMVTNTMPHSSQTPLASKFFMLVIVIQSLSLMMTCFVVKFYNNEQPLPKWFDFVVNKCLARILFMDYCRKKSKVSTKESSLPDNDQLFVKSSTFANNGFVKDDDKNYQVCDPNQTPENEEILETTKQMLNFKENNVKLLEEVKVLSDKIRDMNTKEKLQDEWMFATQVLDRFFLMSILLCTFVVLVLIFHSLPKGSVLT